MNYDSCWRWNLEVALILIFADTPFNLNFLVCFWWLLNHTSDYICYCCEAYLFYWLVEVIRWHCLEVCLFSGNYPKLILICEFFLEKARLCTSWNSQILPMVEYMMYVVLFVGIEGVITSYYIVIIYVTDSEPHILHELGIHLAWHWNEKFSYIDPIKARCPIYVWECQRYLRWIQKLSEVGNNSH